MTKIKKFLDKKAITINCFGIERGYELTNNLFVSMYTQDNKDITIFKNDKVIYKNIINKNTENIILLKIKKIIKRQQIINTPKKLINKVINKLTISSVIEEVSENEIMALL